MLKQLKQQLDSPATAPHCNKEQSWSPMPSNPIHSPDTWGKWNPNAPQYATVHFRCYKSKWIQIWIPKLLALRNHIEMDTCNWNHSLQDFIFFAPLILLLPVSWHTPLKTLLKKAGEKVQNSKGCQPICLHRPNWWFPTHLKNLRVKEESNWIISLFGSGQNKKCDMWSYYMHKRSCSMFHYVAGSCSDLQAYAATKHLLSSNASTWIFGIGALISSGVKRMVRLPNLLDSSNVRPRSPLRA